MPGTALPVTDEIPSASMNSALVTILRPPADISADEDDRIEEPVSESFHALVMSIEESVMYLRAAGQAPVYSALKIETGDALWLGETEKCEREGDSWSIRVRLHHVLRDFDTLGRLAERFGIASPRRASVQA
jgi:hypothetical protein